MYGAANGSSFVDDETFAMERQCIYELVFAKLRQDLSCVDTVIFTFKMKLCDIVICHRNSVDIISFLTSDMKMKLGKK